MKKKVIIGTLLCFAVVLFAVGTRIYFRYTPYSYHDGDVAEWQNSLPSDKAYELAVNEQGQPMFKKPFDALGQMQSDFKDSISLLKSNNDSVFGLHIWNAHDYYGNAKVAFADGVGMKECSEEQKKQMGVLRAALEYYESSFVVR